ncbi:peptidoglycan-binding protein [Streptomyces sp. NPDC007920]|uniref:peptidoglycan-binding domain-containing protein n=1 Tax=Streptomyces sp. NPDC007920 TaxID=3364794 RepID=UPI0036E71009
MSTPPGHGQPHGGEPLEPVRVIRPRRTDALADLMREFREYQRDTADGPAEDPETEELPAAPAGIPAPRRLPDREPAGAGRSLRWAAVAVAVVAAALLGFGSALLLPARGEAAGPAAVPPQPSVSAADPPAQATTPTAGSSADPDGPGTLREGDSGPDVTELQERLRRIPDVYRDGSTGGRYDGELREAVARFQLWYGISGDETGVYGDDTRRALESRTTPDDG